MAGLQISDCRAGVIEVVLSRPPHNLLTTQMCAELTELLTQPPAKAHLLRFRATGTWFCGGRERAGATAGELVAEARTLVGLHRAMRASSLITVTEIQANAAGFGVGLIAASDVAITVADAEFSFPEVGIDLAPALVLAWLPRVIGEREAFWHTATAEPITAHRALQLGLVNEVVDSPEALEKSAAERITALQARNPRIHAEIKAMLRAFDGLDERGALEASVDRLVVGALRRDEITPAGGQTHRSKNSP